MSTIKSGIYKITNKVNGKIYIGSAYNLSNRFSTHQYTLRNNTHKNKHLQAAWNLYGSDCFSFEILELVEDKTELLKREQFYIDSFNSTHKEVGYNKAKFAGNTAGVTPSLETRLKQSETKKRMYAEGLLVPKNKGKKNSKEQNLLCRQNYIDNVAPWSKINWEIAREIRCRYNQGETQKKIAEAFGLFQTTVSEIIRNKIWNDETYVYQRRKNK